jgi:hypothetical protein
VSRPIFELGTFRIRSKIVNYSTTTFGGISTLFQYLFIFYNFNLRSQTTLPFEVASILTDFCKQKDLHLLTISFLFVVYLTTLLSNWGCIASNESVISEWWIGKDLEGSGCDLIFGTITALACRDWEKPRNTSVKIARLRVLIWARGLPNTKQEFQSLDHVVQLTMSRDLQMHNIISPTNSWSQTFIVFSF